MRRKIARSMERSSYYPLQGGEDLITPAITKNPGMLIDSQNYECDRNGRYRAIDGYEAFDGHADLADAQAVPGSGNVLGVWQYKGVKYAFRNTADGTAAKMFKSSTAGWVECDLGREICFTSGGPYEIQEGDTITGATSGATATVKRVLKICGSWSKSTAEGRLILYVQNGTFQAENLNVGSETDVATIAGDSTAHTLNPGGYYEFINHNFYGSSNYYRMYGCDGINPAFEWDGETFVPIKTGMVADSPNHVKALQSHLFLSFPGGSLQASSQGEPCSWSVITGAGELGMGDDITNLQVLPGPVLAVYSRNSTAMLYGTGPSDWVLKPFTDTSGCIERTGQVLGTGIYLDDRGLTTIATAMKYGDYIANSISRVIDPYLRTKIQHVQCSLRVRSKGQYRLYFDDKSGITLTLNGGKVVGFTKTLYDVQPVCCCSVENLSGDEELFFGATDGFVYQLDSGTSFNGNKISRFIRTAYNHLKSPNMLKRIRRIVLEMDAPSRTNLTASVDFSYGDEPQDSSIPVEIAGESPATGKIYVEGVGINFSLLLESNDTIEPHTIEGVTVSYAMRGPVR